MRESERSSDKYLDLIYDDKPLPRCFGGFAGLASIAFALQVFWLTDGGVSRRWVVVLCVSVLWWCGRWLTIVLRGDTQLLAVVCRYTGVRWSTAWL